MSNYLIRIQKNLSLASLVVLTGTAPAAIVSQWSFEGELVDSAASGTTADDLTAIGIAEYAPGIVGQAGKISAGGMQRARAANSADLNLGSNWTIEAFVNPDSNNAGEWDRFWTVWGDGGNEWHWSFRSTGAVTVDNGLDLFINGGNNIINSNNTATVPLDDWSHVALVGDQAANTITAWLNGVQVGSSPWEEIAPTAGAMNFGNFESANGLQFSGLIDEALIHDVAVDQSYLEARATLLVVIDSDVDGLPDLWEQQIIDAAAAGQPPVTLTLSEIKGPDNTPETSDYDLDGATDAEEFANVTDPTNPDTDGDDLLDGVETNTGVWNGSDETGTNPRIADSDMDGLDDGVEDPTEEFVDADQPGTDPNKSDSDGDGFPDGAEIRVGSDPTDPIDRPNSIVVSRWSFEDELADTADDGVKVDNLSDDADGLSYVPGVVGKAVSIRKTVGLANKLTAPNSADLNLVGDWTLEAFVWRDLDNDPNVEWERFWCKWEGDTEYHWAFRGNSGEIVPDGLDLFANNLPVFDHDATTTSLPPETWVHVALVGDQSGSDTIRGYVNGIEVVSTPYVAIAPTAANMTFGNFGTGDQSGLQFSGYIDEAQIHIGAVTPAYLQSRAALLLGEVPKIISIDYLKGSDTATVTWTSGLGRTYSLDWSSDLINWSNVDDSITGKEDQTSWDDETVPLDATRRFYRVTELP